MTLLSENMSEEEYNLLPGIRSTALKYFIKYGARAFWRKYISNEFEPQEETKPLRLGKILHELVIEGKRNWLPWEEGNRSGKNWEAFKYMCEVRGKSIMTPKEERDILRMAASVESNPLAMRLMKETARSEQVIQFEYSGLECKVRIDQWLTNDGFLDTKSTATIEEEEFFKYGIDKFGYADSAAFYEMGIQSHIETDQNLPFWFIAIENKEPFRCVVHDLHEVVFDAARDRVRNALDELVKCYQQDEWQEPLANKVYQYAPTVWWMERNGVQI